MVRQIRFAATSLCLTFSFALSTSAVLADGIRNTTCISSSGAFACTTQWHRASATQHLPWQIDPRETAAAKERERRWLARCRPIARQDQFGVSRYSYAAAGCEFGKVED
jgi:hypothetical protein